MRGISVLLPLAALCSASALPRAEEDAWLAVINGNSAPGPQQLQQEPAGDQTRYQPRPADPRQPRPDNRRVGVAPPPPPQQQPRLPPPPQQRGPPRAPVEVPQPRPGGVPPPQRRGPPPPQQRRPPPPPPPKKEPGLLDTVVQGVNSVLNPVSCAATNLITDEKLKDETFIKSQMDCAMNRGPCDDIGKQIRILAPEVLAGRCPAPCNPCIKDQIRKVMSQLSQKYPREFQQMMASLSRRG